MSGRDGGRGNPNVPRNGVLRIRSFQGPGTVRGIIDESGSCYLRSQIISKASEDLITERDVLAFHRDPLTTH